MKDIRVEIRLKNNAMFKKREEYGFNQEQMAEAIGMPLHMYNGYECLRLSPLTKKGFIKETALKIVEFLDLPFEEIWTPGIEKIKKVKGSFEFESTVYLDWIEDKMLESPESILLEKEIEPVVDKSLSKLSKRQESIVRRHYGIGCKPMTFDEIGEEDGISRGRVQQIEQKALREMRHPRISKKLRLMMVK